MTRPSAATWRHSGLRFAAAALLAAGGRRRALGMPSFADDLTSDQARLIQAYVVDLARRDAAAAKR